MKKTLEKIQTLLHWLQFAADMIEIAAWAVEKIADKWDKRDQPRPKQNRTERIEEDKQ